MIFRTGGDLTGPVDLLQQHDAGQVMGKRHRRHGQPPVGLVLQVLRKAHAAADEERQLAFAGHRQLLHPAAQLHAGAGLPLDAQGDDRPAPGQLFPYGGGLRRQRPLNLRRRGVLRQAALRQLDDLQLAVPPQALGIFGGGLLIELLLQLSHAEDGYLLHGVLSVS